LAASTRAAMNGAEANLLRLSEVSAELERQLASLKRQAGKARRYQRLSDDIQGLEALAAHLRWIEARLVVEATRAELSRASDDVERFTRADAAAETARIAAGEGISPLRETESVAAARLGQARIALARLETEQTAAADAEARLVSEASRLMADLVREEAAREEASRALTHAINERGALPVDDETENAAIEATVREHLAAVRAALIAAEAHADAVQAEVSELRARRRAAEETAAAQSRRQDTLAAEIARLNAEIAGLEVADVLGQRLAAAAESEARAEMALHDAERAVDAAEQHLASSRAAETAAERPFAEADSAVRALLAEISGLEKLLRKADGHVAPAVIERIRTHDGFEKAVAAALGDDIEASTDTSAALYWGGAAVSGMRLPPGAEALTEYVSAPGELAARLAQCGLVSPEDGDRLKAELQPGQRLVSRDGHLWRWDGFIRTPDAPASAAARLEQQARLEAAQMDIAAFRDALDEAEAERADVKAARGAAEDSMRDLRQQISPAQRVLADARRACAEAQASAERAALRRETSTEALARAEADRAATTDALAALIPQTDGAGDEARLDADLLAAREAVNAQRAAEIEARGQLTDMTRGREQAAARRVSLERDIATWTNRQHGSAARLEELVARRASAAQEALAAAARPAAIGAEIARVASDVDRLETERREVSDTLALRLTAQREAETAARLATAAASEARESLAGARVKLEMAEARLTEITALAETNFQRPPEDLLTLAEASFDGEDIGAFSVRDIDQRLDAARRDREQLGGVNMNAGEEADALEARLGLQISEREDLTQALARLREGIHALNAEGRERLVAAFEIVNEHFKALFTALFQGGQAELKLIDADDPLNAGLEIYAQPPGKKLGTLALMSGGEQALTAAALIFAVFLSRPAPICVLDEVDAPLDDANVDRFCNMLNEMRQRTQTRFVVITHNPVTMSRMDRLFGVTMREKGVSKLVSVDLQAAEQLVAAA
jgi:chromosome segregation protein